MVKTRLLRPVSVLKKAAGWPGPNAFATQPFFSSHLEVSSKCESQKQSELTSSNEKCRFDQPNYANRLSSGSQGLAIGHQAKIQSTEEEHTSSNELQ
jgi:hypothetical protein